ncbi:MAG TPA: hypothetical protein VJN71_09455 [Nitrososphaerales archaeon]|nr:hypothetical protein [Nitrososphaerales archaeon]
MSNSSPEFEVVVESNPKRDIYWNKKDYERVLSQVREEYGSMAMLLNDQDLAVINELRKDPNVSEFEVQTCHRIEVSVTATKRGLILPRLDISFSTNFHPSRTVRVVK